VQTGDSTLHYTIQSKSESTYDELKRI